MLRDGSSSAIVSRGWYDDMCVCVCVCVRACLPACCVGLLFSLLRRSESGVKEVRGCRISTASRDETVVDGL